LRPGASAAPRSALVDAVVSLLSESGRSVGPLTAMVMRANYNVRGRLTLYLFEEGQSRPAFVAKLARTRRARAVLEAERDAYESLLARSEFLERQPPRHYSRNGDLTFVVEEFVSGGSIERLRGRPEFESLVTEWLDAFQSASAGRELRKSDLLERLRRLREAAGLDPFHGLVDDAVARVGSLPEFTVAEVPVHGDFAPANLLLDGDRLYVTDWEWLRLDGWPLDDLWWFFLVSAKHAGLANESSAAGAARVLDDITGRTKRSGRLREAGVAFAERRGVMRGLLPAFGVITLLEMALRWRVERIDWRTAPTAAYEEVLRGLADRRDEFWSFWRGEDGHGRA
jgi:hypothetical protein